MKIDLTDVEFQIPVAIDHNDRLENLELLVNYLLHHFDTNITVFESSKESQLHNQDFIKKTKYEFIKNDSEVFHRTKILNLMAKASNKPIIVNQDTDVLLNVQNYVEAANAIRNTSLDIVYPYDGRFMEVTRDLVPKIKENWDVSWIKESDCNVLHPSSVGGMIFENREKFLEVKGENLHLKNWGWEDNERYVRFLKLGLKVGRVQGFLIHIFHWRGKSSGPDHENYYSNCMEFNKVNNMTKEQLVDYLKTWDLVEFKPKFEIEW